MPATFTSYWGSSLHGVEIAWTNDITANPVELSFVYTCNYYWRMPFWYDSAEATDAALFAAVGGSNHGVDITGTGSGAYFATKNAFKF